MESDRYRYWTEGAAHITAAGPAEGAVHKASRGALRSEEKKSRA